MTAPINSGQYSQLVALVNQYGSIAHIPPNLLSALGITPSQAAVVMGQSQGVTNPGAAAGKSDPIAGILTGIGHALSGTPVPIAGNPTRAPAASSLSDALGGIFGGYGSVGKGIGNIASRLGDIITGKSNPPQTQYHDSWTPRPDLPKNPALNHIEGTIGSKPPAPNVSSIIDSITSGIAGQLQQAPPPPPQYQFKLNDFTDKANELTAKAYSPQFAAITQAEKQVGDNYAVAKQVVDGLYQKLGAANTQATKDINASYDKSKAAATQNTADATAAINQGYTSSQQQVADLLKSIGAGGDASAEVLSRAIPEQGYQAGQAAQAGQAQQNALDTGRQGMNDYQNAMGQAYATQGTVSQENLLHDKNALLNDYSQQRLNLSGQQGQQALQLGQQLSQQDLGLQQLNYGAGQDYYNSLVNGINANNQNVLAIAQQQAAQQKAAYDIWYQQQQDAIANQQKQQQLDINGQQVINQNSTDLAKLELQRQQMQNDYNIAKAKLQGTGSNSDPTSVVLQQATNIVGGNPKLAQAYLALVQEQAYYPGYVPTDPRAFGQAVRKAAAAAGLDENIADAVAQAYYYSPLGAGYPSGGKG